MSVLHSSFAGVQVKGPDGKTVAVHPKFILANQGPRIPVVLALPDQLVEEFTKQNQAIPAPISGWALIDTGAGHTCIDEGVATKLKLPIVNKATMASASHPETEANVYPVKFLIPNLLPDRNTPLVIGAPLDVQGLVALIGRDALTCFHLTYNGGAGEFTLCA